jgi:hypothetical protein
MEIHSLLDTVLPDSEGIKVAIKTYSLRQQHVGIYFKANGDPLKILHQPGHYEVLVDTPDHKYLWLDVQLDEPNQIHMATFCAMIGQMNSDGIAYSICHKGTSFDNIGNFQTEEVYAGLTCATFVMRIFESNGFPIINEEDWSHIVPDKAWQKQILQGIKQAYPKIDENHIVYQLKRRREGVTRYKPEEVACAAALPLSDKGYAPEDVHDGAELIMSKLSQHLKAL